MSDMRAAQYDSYGPPEVLHLARVAVPEARPGQVLVRVAASSINGADVDVRAGKLKVLSGRRFPRGAGFDFAGDVVAVGDGVTDYGPGDGVWGFLKGLRAGPSAAAAEYVVASVKDVSRRPMTVDAVDAASLPGAGAAALGVLRDKARLQAGERVLIRGGAGGVGSAAVQIAHAMGGQVTALVSPQHIDRVRGLGAKEAYDYHNVDPSGLRDFDVILDPVGRDLRTHRRLLAKGGRMESMIVHGGSQFAYLAASTVFGGRRVRFAQMPPTHQLLADLAGMVDGKDVQPVIDSVYPLDDIAAAHRSVEAGGGFGKRVVILD